MAISGSLEASFVVRPSKMKAVKASLGRSVDACSGYSQHLNGVRCERGHSRRSNESSDISQVTSMQATIS